MKLHFPIQLIKEKGGQLRVPKHIRNNYIKTPPLNPNNQNDIDLTENFTRLNSDTRLMFFRNKLIPWLDNIRCLKNLRILEIGCGTGSSTIAFSEQSLSVTAIDLNEDFLHEAATKCQILGFQTQFYKLNAIDIDRFFPIESFDLIVFMASLEHMTLLEREQSLASAYKLLPKGGLLCITGSPNRLHFLDSHTSLLPFFHWLPDELAMKYSKFSKRVEYRNHICEIKDDKEGMEPFYRWGRGISFHEIEIALNPLNELEIISDLTSYIKRKNYAYAFASVFTTNYWYEKFLSHLYPSLNKAFFRPYIDIVIEK